MGMPPPSVLETDKMSGAIRWRTSSRLGFAAGICFPSRITIAMVSFWLNLFLSFTQGAVAENADAYTLILQPGKSYLREEACSSKISAVRWKWSNRSRQASNPSSRCALNQTTPCPGYLAYLFQRSNREHSIEEVVV